MFCWTSTKIYYLGIVKTMLLAKSLVFIKISKIVRKIFAKTKTTVAKFHLSRFSRTSMVVLDLLESNKKQYLLISEYFSKFTFISANLESVEEPGIPYKKFINNRWYY